MEERLRLIWPLFFPILTLHNYIRYPKIVFQLMYKGNQSRGREKWGESEREGRGEEKRGGRERKREKGE